MQKIPFNKPFIAGKELFYIARAVTRGEITGDGCFTRGCGQILAERFGIRRVLMTPSCTAALEMAAMLCEVGPADEVILPSFTFVSTANAFIRLGAKPVFVDIRPDTLNIDETKIEAAVTPRTKVICPVHFASVGCEMETIMELAADHGLRVVEDAAQGVNAEYRGRALGSIGHLGTYSFHETKNFTAGEGGALCINDADLIGRAEIIREKGTDRSRFLRGEIERYTWIDVGSSYIPNEISCAYLYAQLELMDEITRLRRKVSHYYRNHLQELEAEGLLRLPVVPETCQENFHMFYLLLADQSTRDALISHLRGAGISAVFHYVPLHSSPKGRQFGYEAADLPITQELSGRLVRLPFYCQLTENELERVVHGVRSFFS